MARFIPINDIIKLALLGNNDFLQRDKGKLLYYSKYVWQDMNMTTTKVPIREFFKINKRTNSIDLKCDFLQLSSVDVMDECGVLHPVFRNDKLHDDMVDVGAAKDCACEFKCGYQLCNTIKGYEACVSTKTDKNPDGSDVSFTCVDRKAIDGQGFFYEQIQYPQRIYEDGIWTETVLHTEDRKLCKVELDSNGCCCDTDANIDAVCGVCGITDSSFGTIPFGGNSVCPPNRNDDTWIYWCSTKLDWFSVQCGCFPRGFKRGCNNIYNISELGDRLIFPANFGWDRVLVRYYADVKLSDLQIPFIAVDTFIMGLKWWDARFNDKKQNIAEKYGHDYSKLKWGLLLELNKYRIAEQRMILAPPVYVPSFYLQLPYNSYNNNSNNW